MFPLLSTGLRATAIVLLELVGFFFFYNHPHGRHAVYFSWYAGIIDTLAIFSGSVIMASSVYAMHNPELFTISVPQWLLWIIFIIGSWQAAIHLVKIVIRARKNRA